MKIRAPFTPQQVEALNKYQALDYRHPFTCPNRGDGNHIHNGHDLGVLTATCRGWVCYSCEYTQGWAWKAMADAN